MKKFIKKAWGNIKPLLTNPFVLLALHKFFSNAVDQFFINLGAPINQPEPEPVRPEEPKSEEKPKANIIPMGNDVTPIVEKPDA